MGSDSIGHACRKLDVAPNKENGAGSSYSLGCFVENHLQHSAARHTDM